ncbi:Phosducin thioredoxin-like domain-containing protein [Plasmodiophora brassicae]|nr:hypothetical protein PBRA_002941 [Plasmodiophora brassicae]
MSDDSGSVGECACDDCGSDYEVGDDRFPVAEVGQSEAMMPPPALRPSAGGSCNTGPKGVMADYRAAQLKMRAARFQKEAEFERLLERMAVGDPVDFVPESGDVQPNVVSGDADDDDNAELEAIRRRRLNQLKSNLPVFGKLAEVTPRNFISFVEDVDKRTVVLIAMYKPEVRGCARLNLSLAALAKKFTRVRFGRMVISDAVPGFDSAGLPALVAYRGGERTHSFVPLTGWTGEHYTDRDLVLLLCRQKLLSEESLASAGYDDDVSDSNSNNDS